MILINQETWQNQLLWNKKLFFSFKNEAGYLNFWSDSIFFTIFDFSLPGAHKNIDLLFVGGCIRSCLLNKEIKDIDFAISCNPSNTIKILSENKIKYQDYGLSHGSITAIIDKTKSGQ